MKKISSIVLILAMLLNLGGFSVFAESGDATGHIPGGYTSVGYTYSGKTEHGVARIWGDAYVNPRESFVIEIYSGETLISTTNLNNVGGFLNGEYRELTWNNNIIGNFDEYWTTVWEEGHPVSNFVPDNLIMYVDGVEVDRQVVQMNRADNLDPVIWEEIEGVANAKNDVVEVTSYKELAQLFTNVDRKPVNVKMLNDITGPGDLSSGYGVAGIIVQSGDILDGNGYTLTITGADTTWDCAVGVKGGTVKNLTVAGAFRGFFMSGANGDVLIENCKTEDVTYTFNSDAGSKDYDVRIVDTTLNGWTSFSNVHKSVTFENCTFGEGRGYAYCRPYQATEFKDCEFNEGFEIDTRQPGYDDALAFNGCRYAGEALSKESAAALFSDGGTVLIDGVSTIFEKFVAVAKIGDKEYASLQSALDAAAAGKGNVTVDILKDIDLTNVEWNPVTISAPGYPLVTVNGNNKTITGLKDMLFAGTWAGKSGLIINDLTIENAYIVNDAEDNEENVGVGAFIGYPQASATITLNNCHLVKSHVEGGHWTGGLIGMAGGYNGDDGPVFMNLTIEKCSVTDSNITGKGSVGGIIGHGSCAAWTNVEIKDTTVFRNTIKSTGSKDNKAGIVMGTIGAAGTAQTVNGITHIGGVKVSVIESGNIATSNETTIKTVYGRQGTSTGVLTITGGTYENNPIEDNVTYAAPVEGFEIVQNTDETYGIKEIEEQANLNTRIYFLHRDATETSPIDGNQAYRTRVYAGVDSLKYKSVGFEYRLLNTELPQLKTHTDTVYRKLTVTVGGVATPLTPEMFKASEDGADLSHIFALNIFVPEAYGGYRLEVRAYAEREDETKIYTEWYKAPYNSNGTAVK